MNLAGHKKVKVMAFGTFDIFHLGHIYFLKQAKKKGGQLVVVVARDKTVKKVKGELPKNDEKHRKLKIEESGLADKVILGHPSDMYYFIKKEKPDVIALGYDQTAFARPVRNVPDDSARTGKKANIIYNRIPTQAELFNGVDKLEEKLLKFGLKDAKIVRVKSYHPEKYKSSKLK